jgi:hypothetical protein
MKKALPLRHKKLARPAKPSEQERKANINMNDLLKETGNAVKTCTDKTDKGGLYI